MTRPPSTSTLLRRADRKLAKANADKAAAEAELDRIYALAIERGEHVGCDPMVGEPSERMTQR